MSFGQVFAFDTGVTWWVVYFVVHDPKGPAITDSIFYNDVLVWFCCCCWFWCWLFAGCICDVITCLSSGGELFTIDFFSLDEIDLELGIGFSAKGWRSKFLRWCSNKPVFLICSYGFQKRVLFVMGLWAAAKLLYLSFLAKYVVRFIFRSHAQSRSARFFWTAAWLTVAAIGSNEVWNKLLDSDIVIVIIICKSIGNSL